MKKKNPLGRLVTLSLAALLAESAHGHGYVSAPPSRNLLCKQAVNTACGAVVYEPQSLEGLSGFPTGGPQDGRIASAGLWQFSELDVQNRGRWARQPMQAGPFDFRWTFTANHVSRNFRYYLTRPDWNPDQPLSRASFELTPFCIVDGKMQRPPSEVTHRCVVPARTGYQLVLAVWEIGDTVNSFYNLIDADFGAGSGAPVASPTPTPTPTPTPPPTPTPAPWEVRGTLVPSLDLAVGDSITTRVFDVGGERPEWSTTFRIEDAADASAQVWSYRLAMKINQEQTQIRAGQKNAAGQIVPVLGSNPIYADPKSGIERVETRIDRVPVLLPFLSLEGIPASLTLKGVPLSLDIGLRTEGLNEVSLTLVDETGQVAATKVVPLTGPFQTIGLILPEPKAGRYTLTAVGRGGQPPVTIQKTQALSVLAEEKPAPQGNYQFVFPNGLSQYRAGTLVLNPKTGRVYECRPWPYNGYCVQWSEGSNQFEPGIGSAWSEAWIPR